MTHLPASSIPASAATAAAAAAAVHPWAPFCCRVLPLQQRWRQREREVCARAEAEMHACRDPPAAASGLDLVGFTLIIDDIVSPDGASSMGRLGGGGPQTLWGFQLQRGQEARVGLAAGIGSDFPDDCLHWLQGCGVDISGLLLCEGSKTPRAWQILEEDGRRHEIWRTPFTEQLVSMLRPRLAELPPAYQQAKAFHVGVHPQDPSLPLLQELRAATGTKGLVSAETFAAASTAVPGSQLSAFMSQLDVFSPNEAEAASMLYGTTQVPEAARGDPRRLTEPFLEAGARLVAVRQGPLGAVVQDAASGAAWHVPAYPSTCVVDPTGCGNAFCGALLAALQAGESLAAAAGWGCAAGSLMAECSGTPAAPPCQLAQAARERQAAVLSMAVEL